MGFSFSGGGSKGSSKSTTNPWAKQSPYLEQGFGRAEDILNQGPYQGQWWVDPNQMQTHAAATGFENAGQANYLQNIFQGMGGDMAGGLGESQDFFSQLMTGGVGNFQNPWEAEQYDRLRGDAWNPTLQAASDQAWESISEKARRSDFGDAMGASLSGQGTGAASDRYLQSRQNVMSDAMRSFGDAEVGLRMQGLNAAENRAGSWAGAQMQGDQFQLGNQIGAAGQLAGLGTQGMDFLNQGWGIGQTGAAAAAGWGDYMGNFEKERLAGEMAQHDAPMQNLLNAWNIWGGANWGGTTKGKTKSASASFGF